MTDLPTKAPSAHATLGSQAWKQYKHDLEQWDAWWASRWIEQDALRIADKYLDGEFRSHPQYRGKPKKEVFLGLLREARQAQIAYRLYEAHPKPVEDIVRMEAVFQSRNWVAFGGDNWAEMTANQLASNFERMAEPPYHNWLETDFFILASNRLLFEEFADVQGKRPTFKEYEQARKTAERYPNETNIAKFLRTSRPYVLGLSVVTVLAGWLMGIPFTKELAIGAIVFLLLTYLLYPKTLVYRR